MKYKDLARYTAVVLLFLVLAIVVYAGPTEPTGPTRITESNFSRYNTSNYPAIEIEAEAGNITRLTITAKTQTLTWQGYYGDITGVITLEDAYNYTMYDWYLAEPQGEIYASTALVTNWDTVHCLNYTNNGTYHNYTWDNGTVSTYTDNVINLTELEESLGLSPFDTDGVDETFNISGSMRVGRNSTSYTYEDHDDFFVGTIYIGQGTCPATNTYETQCLNITDPDPQDWLKVDKNWCNGTWAGNYTWQASEDGNNFQEVLLTVNNSETVIYTTIIENRRLDNDTEIYGFNNATWDFQLIVGEDGHPGPSQDTPTSYYFYVELE